MQNFQETTVQGWVPVLAVHDVKNYVMLYCMTVRKYKEIHNCYIMLEINNSIKPCFQ